ncbi:MAG: nucleotidyltransferase domain-containing protein [Acidimicrobiia bacterium]
MEEDRSHLLGGDDRVRLIPTVTSDLPAAIASLVDQLASLPHVVGVTLDDPQSHGSEADDHGWNLGVYYRTAFNPADLSHLDGSVGTPGEWGRIVNGGATLSVDSHCVRIYYRDIDEVRHWIREAGAGRFEIEGSNEHLAGAPSCTVAAELALGTVLAGSFDEAIEYPERLAEEGAARWRDNARSSLERAGDHAERGDRAGVLGHLARALVEIAHARLCEARRWTTNEKEILERAELTHLNQLLTALDADPVMLMQRVMQARALLGD